MVNKMFIVEAVFMTVTGNKKTVMKAGQQGLINFAVYFFPLSLLFNVSFGTLS